MTITSMAFPSVLHDPSRVIHAEAARRRLRARPPKRPGGYKVTITPSEGVVKAIHHRLL